MRLPGLASLRVRILSWSASITVHLVLILSVSSPFLRSPTPVESRPIEIEVAQAPAPDPQRLASTEDAQNRLTPKKADIYSSHDQSVSKPTRANSGPEFQGGEPGRRSAGLTLSDLGLSSSFEGQNALGATTDDSLTDIELGQKTLLNAKEYAHWLYFQRIKSLLGPIWRLDIDEKMRSMQRAGRKLAKNESVTQVAVILNTSGAVRKTIITQSSGSEMLDKSAVSAFLAASPFPNPPTALHQKDGTVSIRWTFIVNQKPTRITYDHDRAGPPGRSIN